MQPRWPEWGADVYALPRAPRCMPCTIRGISASMVSHSPGKHMWLANLAFASGSTAQICETLAASEMVHGLVMGGFWAQFCWHGKMLIAAPGS